MADRLIDGAAATARVREAPAIDADNHPAFRSPNYANKEIDSRALVGFLTKKADMLGS